MQYEIDISSNGKELTAEEGDLVRLELVEMPSAGFLWELECKGLELISEHNNLESITNAGMIGGSILWTRLYKVQESGGIKGKHRRPWLDKDDLQEEFKLCIKVG